MSLERCLICDFDHALLAASLPDCIQHYCLDKKTRYMQQSILPESEWPPPIGGDYVTLAMIKHGRSMYEHRYESFVEQQIDYTRGNYDRIMQRKTKIDIQDAFKQVVCEGGNELQLKMLIDGAPGVGKTTLSRKVSCMWAKGEILERYWLVLLLHLRESGTSKAKSINDFFYHDDADLQERVVKFVRERSGHGVLIIFDGFDELSFYERSEESLFLDVIRGKILPLCAVVVTSRPYASCSIQELPLINRHVEVLGFTEQQIKTCIGQRIENQRKAEELCLELKDRLDITSICQVPLNCSIVLYVYEQEDYHLPRTLTELYNLFVLHSLKRFIKRTLSGRVASKLHSLGRLPVPCKNIFKLLCKLAFEGLKGDQLVFSEDDLDSLFLSGCEESDADPPVLDLMTSAKSYSSRGAQDTYSFLHLTIQEFLAAYWVANYSSDVQKLWFLKQKVMKDRFRMVLLFLSGMSNLSFPDATSVFTPLFWENDKVHLCHLTYEAGSHSLCKYICDNCCTSRDVELTGSRFDALVVSNFVAFSNCLWNRVTLRPDDVKIMHSVLSSQKLQCCTFIKKVIVCFNGETKDIDATLLTFLDGLPQIHKVGVDIDISGGGRISTLVKIFGKVKNKRYSIRLTESASSASERRKGVIVAEFCEALANSLVHNHSIAEVSLTHVLPGDIKCILASLSARSSVSRVEYLACFKGNRKCSHLVSCDEEEHFYATLSTLLLSNKSLVEIYFDLDLSITLIQRFMELIASGLARNTTLQKVTLVPNVVTFERSPTTQAMELNYGRGFPKMGLLPVPFPNIQTNTPDTSLLSPLNKRLRKQSSLPTLEIETHPILLKPNPQHLEHSQSSNCELGHAAGPSYNTLFAAPETPHDCDAVATGQGLLWQVEPHHEFCESNGKQPLESIHPKGTLDLPAIVIQVSSDEDIQPSS